MGGKMKKRTEENGTRNNDWETPKYIYNYIEKEFFNGRKDYFDPCPLNWLQTDHSKPTTDNGLLCDWYDINYINPPYSPAKLKEAFIKRAYEESKKGKLCVMLIPASTETKIFHEVIIPNAKVILIKKRVQFKGHNSKGEYVTNKSGQSGSMFVIFGKDYSPAITTIDLDGDKILDTHGLTYRCNKCNRNICKSINKVHTIMNQNKEETEKNFQKVIEENSKRAIERKPEDQK